MAEQKTQPTSQSPSEFIALIPEERRRTQAERVLELMAEATGEEATMWGSSMIGFGAVHYRYKSGREGDTHKVGFSPRKSALSLYGLQGHPGSAELLAKLGTFTAGAGCVYVKKLEDIDLGILRKLIVNGFEHAESTLNSF